MAAEKLEYEIWLGSFEGSKFKWKKIKSFMEYDEAFKYFTNYVNKQLSYTIEEFFEIWDSSRLDIELKHDDKLLHWRGVFNKKTKDVVTDEDLKIEDCSFGPRF